MSSVVFQFAQDDAVVGFGLSSGWWVLLLGWPAIAAAATAFSIAIVLKSRPAAAVGCALAAPMFLYLALLPGMALLPLLALALLLVLAWRVDKRRRLVSGLLALPAASLVVWLAYALLTR